MLTQLGKSKIAIMGLGYVGLPLAEAFAEKYKIICYDINPIRVDEWQKGKGRTFELTDTELQQVLVKTGL
jgi:UDP-N-acetyl-D-galactosamine dehydrogenase